MPRVFPCTRSCAPARRAAAAPARAVRGHRGCPSRGCKPFRLSRGAFLGPGKSRPSDRRGCRSRSALARDAGAAGPHCTSRQSRLRAERKSLCRSLFCTRVEDACGSPARGSLRARQPHAARARRAAGRSLLVRCTADGASDLAADRRMAAQPGRASACLQVGEVRRSLIEQREQRRVRGSSPACRAGASRAGALGRSLTHRQPLKTRPSWEAADPSGSAICERGPTRRAPTAAERFIQTLLREPRASREQPY